ncbi:hypothetical protein E6O75_ATG11061 [Venturia nashicola]|uniref:C3H1-type domain-containing protein n=1 Tax=Venturia nashicola TaxID=86259 RepID=A0A4Z1P1C8_9PEZI|nr:hypothetical protein E6O75_ATG11061 [Venturia nashicola]
MNNPPHPQPQGFSPAQARPQNGRALHNRHSGDFRNGGPQVGANGNGPMPVPAIPRVPNGNGQNGLAGARSPPSARTTSHVPCKFFRQGACQAGKACPFLHSEAPTACKYFQKGNCKFGLKCANEHITADGRRVNKPNGYVMGAGNLNLGGRVMPSQGPPPTSSLLTMQQDHLSQPQPIPGQAPLDYMNPDMWKKQPYDIPVVETTYSSHPGSTYGSPQNEGRLPMSPIQKGLSLLDAPLPASFDSQGVSHIARNGPFASSMPSRFGLDMSPTSSSPMRPMESSALRNLHSSAFGDDNLNGKGGMASSPPAVMDEPIGRRIMHSERFSRQPRMISASVGAHAPINDVWDDEGFTFEEDLVPNSLHELLTPQERMRRFSRTNDEDHRQALSGLGTPNESSPKIGSPSTASPSRFGAFFAGRQKEASDSAAASAFGHVGSPLRNLSLHPGASPSLRAIARPISGDVSPFLSSPPSQSSMSMISQQMQRTRISSGASDTLEAARPLQHPGITRVASGSSGVPGVNPRHSLDRAVSSSSVGREKIDEEPELFSMDDDLDRKKENAKRSSGGSAWVQGSPFSLGKSNKASPTLGPIGGQRTPSSGGPIANPWNK